MELSEFMETRSRDLGITQSEISTRTGEKKCAKAGGRALSRPRVNQLWHNKPEMRVLPPESTIIALAYALKCDPGAVYVAMLHTIGVLQADGPFGFRFVAVQVNGFDEDEMQRIVHAGQSAMSREADLITRTEQRERG
jgi:transcriptional regulator with XRE-family HTH domain